MEARRESLPRLNFSRGTLLLDGLGAAGRHAALRSGSWAWDPRVAAWRADAISYPLLRDRLRAGAFALEDHVPGWQRVLWPRVDLPALRPEQSQAVAA